MKIKIKKLNKDAVIPSKAHRTDAGLDLVAISKIYDKYGNVSYGTGIAIEIPSGYVGLLFPRSSNSKYDLLLCNSVGVIDSGYRGEIFLKFKPSAVYYDDIPATDADQISPNRWGVDSNTFDYVGLPGEGECFDYKVGDKIGQLIILPYPEIEFDEVSVLSDSDRGEGGFGSTGK